MNSIPAITQIQQAAKRVLEELTQFIRPTSTEQTIVDFATRRLAELGLPDTWYYECPALVLLGSRSCMSPSGRDYVPSNEMVGNKNLVTVDLSLCQGRIWGDCARSFVVETGTVTAAPSESEFQHGMFVQTELHKNMRAFVRPETTCHQLYEFTMDKLASLKYENLALRYENLDSSGNFGHSICTSLGEREFLTEGNRSELGTFTAFTFEPHIRAADGIWGFKHENIYYFANDGTANEV